MPLTRRICSVRPIHTRLKKKKGRNPLLLLCIFLLLGAALGCAFALLGGGHPELSQQLTSYVQWIAQGNRPTVSIWAAIWEVLSWPLLLFLLSFGAPGILGIPFVILARGFLLSYACTSFVAMYGLPGLAWNVIFYGVSSLLLLPVCLCIGHWGLINALNRFAPQEDSAQVSLSLHMLMGCCLFLCLSFILQMYVLPAWLPGLCQKLSQFMT